MTDGARPDRIVYDEVPTVPDIGTRTAIAQRPDGTTYALEFPADWDLGDVLPHGDVIAVDAGTSQV